MALLFSVQSRGRVKTNGEHPAQTFGIVRALPSSKCSGVFSSTWGMFTVQNRPPGVRRRTPVQSMRVIWIPMSRRAKARKAEKGPSGSIISRFEGTKKKRFIPPPNAHNKKPWAVKHPLFSEWPLDWPKASSKNTRKKRRLTHPADTCKTANAFLFT